MTLAKLVVAAHAAGARVTVGLEPQKIMPARWPNDAREVTLLIEESERCTALANKWLDAEVPNTVAAKKLMEMGWAHSLSAAWLRCKLNGQLKPEKAGD